MLVRTKYHLHAVILWSARTKVGSLSIVVLLGRFFACGPWQYRWGKCLVSEYCKVDQDVEEPLFKLRWLLNSSKQTAVCYRQGCEGPLPCPV